MTRALSSRSSDSHFKTWGLYRASIASLSLHIFSSSYWSRISLRFRSAKMAVCFRRIIENQQWNVTLHRQSCNLLIHAAHCAMRLCRIDDRYSARLKVLSRVHFSRFPRPPSWKHLLREDNSQEMFNSLV